MVEDVVLSDNVTGVHNVPLSNVRYSDNAGSHDYHKLETHLKEDYHDTYYKDELRPRDIYVLVDESFNITCTVHSERLIKSIDLPNLLKSNVNYTRFIANQSILGRSKENDNNFKDTNAPESRYMIVLNVEIWKASMNMNGFHHCVVVDENEELIFIATMSITVQYSSNPVIEVMSWFNGASWLIVYCTNRTGVNSFSTKSHGILTSLNTSLACRYLTLSTNFGNNVSAEDVESTNYAVVLNGSSADDNDKSVENFVLNLECWNGLTAFQQSANVDTIALNASTSNSRPIRLLKISHDVASDELHLTFRTSIAWNPLVLPLCYYVTTSNNLHLSNQQINSTLETFQVKLDILSDPALVSSKINVCLHATIKYKEPQKPCSDHIEDFETDAARSMMYRRCDQLILSKINTSHWDFFVVPSIVIAVLFLLFVTVILLCRSRICKHQNISMPIKETDSSNHYFQLDTKVELSLNHYPKDNQNIAISTSSNTEDPDNSVENNNNDVGNFVNNVGNDIQNAGNDIHNVGNDIHNVGNDVHNAGNDINNVGNDINNVGNDINNVGNDINNVGNDINNVGSGINDNSNDINRNENDMHVVGNCINNVRKAVTNNEDDGDVTDSEEENYSKVSLQHVPISFIYPPNRKPVNVWAEQYLNNDDDDGDDLDDDDGDHMGESNDASEPDSYCRSATVNIKQNCL
ncbi:hypothetical protein HELRODRAFT_160359 [Helobdella robusta]|uniref:Uncharacterized protein n=1 Tax=Helobdella robusta TaxID=6412 RepID=T1EQ50_HELRO|nr:hypothetical protein HELRODRAFT_160359 [Helobdella robusta]ESO06202.1 hypothetical protein HELRODRAFT_160359 [Helobdella robusta]